MLAELCRFSPFGFFYAHTTAITTLSPSPDGRRLATAGMDNRVKACTKFEDIQQIFSASAGLRGRTSSDFSTSILISTRRVSHSGGPPNRFERPSTAVIRRLSRV